MVFSANRFHIIAPKLVGLFIRRLDDVNHRSLAVRSVLLDVYVSSKNDEREWDNTFCALAEALKNLRHIKIDINEQIWSGYYWTRCIRRHSPAHEKAPFLRGLLELKKLPLKAVELVVSEKIFKGEVPLWTAVQKRDWAQKMKRAILGSD